MERFKTSENKPKGPLPLIILNARKIDISDLQPIPYDPRTQMSVLGGDTRKMMGSRDKSTCSRSSSTGERIRDFGKSDDDRKVDD